MAGEFRYPLTRFCLRSGSMTLPRAMVGLFPDSGTVTAVDTRTDTEHELTLQTPRVVVGLGEVYREHRLAVNDELVVRQLEDGRIALTAVARPRAPDYATPEGIADLLDELDSGRARLTEHEIRALHDVPEEVDIAGALEADGRFRLHEGRWITAAALPDPGDERPPERAAQPNISSLLEAGADLDEAAEALQAVGVGADEPVGAGVGASAAVSGGRGRAAREADDSGVTALGGAGSVSSQPLHAPPPHVFAGQRGGVPPAPLGATSETVIARRAPSVVVDEPVGELAEDEPDVEVTDLTNRLRRVMGPLGYQIEPLGVGQLSLTASLGRRGYRALVQLLVPNERLDWADLLLKRRAHEFRHLAVVGDHQALVRLTGPAELARATLWSWQGLERLAGLNRTVPLSPVDLEPHFERDGLFEQGLKRFEAAVAERVAERGAVSAVLLRLNQIRAPAVFLLEDLVGEVNLPRDRVLAILERLSAAPFDLLARVDQGEFVLRQGVSAALSGLSSYALSLRDSLPAKHVERLTATGEPDLLVAGEEDQEDVEPTSEGGLSA